MRTFFRHLAAWLRRGRLDDELREEIEAHIESRTQALIADGMNQRDAMREARRQFGNVARVAEQAREARGFPTLESLVHDLRYGVRLLWRTPFFTAVAVASIAGGMTGAIGVVAVTNALLSRPFAGFSDDVQRIFTSTRSGSPFGPNSFADLQDYAASPAVAGTCAVAHVRANVTARTASAPREGAIVSEGCFHLLDLRPAHGRLTLRQGAPEVVIGHALWQRAFGGDPSAVGANVQINGLPAVVIGVAPRGFHGTSFDHDSSFWVLATEFRALVAPASLEDRRNRMFTAFARLRDGVTPRQAQSALAGVAAALAQQDPSTWTDGSGAVRRITIMKETDARFATAPGVVPAMLLGTSGVVAAIVAVACVNIATMLLARGAGRTRELTIRLAMGASRRRLLRQLATETLIIAALGTSIALGLVIAGFRAFEMLRPPGVPAFDLAVDWRVVLFAAAATALATLLCGVLPATHVVRLAIADGMKGQAATIRTTWLRAGAREALIVVQVTVSIAVLFVSAVFAKGLIDGAASSLGFSGAGIATIAADLEPVQGADAPALGRMLIERIESLPNVDAVSLAAIIPLSGTATHFRLGSGDGAWLVDGNVVSPGYFEMMRIALRRGRDFTDGDRRGAPGVVIVSETMARVMWQTTDVVGRTLPLGKLPVEVVGVVADIRYRSVSAPYPPLVYTPIAQHPDPRRFIIHARIRGGGETLAAMDAAARSVDPRILVDSAVLLDRRLDEIRQPERAGQWLGVAAGAAQFALALMALWALVAYSVARRTREIGIRVALGATQGGVVRLLVRPAVLLIGAGCVLGSALGVAGAIALQSNFIGLAPIQPAAGIPAMAIMALTAIVAAIVPALRATSVDPNVALRTE
jgi:putative ABC transport system permease protein